MRCGLLGRTLSHSHSPLLHSLLGSYDYALFEIPPEQVEDFLRSGPWDGLNVTIPYKRTAYALCDSLSPAAREAGNVNTLLRRPDGSLYGDNTDAFGFSYLLENPVFLWPAGRFWSWAPEGRLRPFAPFYTGWARASPPGIILSPPAPKLCAEPSPIFPHIGTESAPKCTNCHQRNPGGNVPP